MKAYIGTKIVWAEPMTKKTYRESVEYRGPFTGKDTEGYRVVNDFGDSVWIPKTVFDRYFREVSDEEKEPA